MEGLFTAQLARPSALAESQEMLAQVLSAYGSAKEFGADLETLRTSLAANRGLRIARNLIDPLLLLARTFGLHLHTLDIRQHARVHAIALKEAIADSLEETLPGRLSAETASVLETFRVIAEVKASKTPEVIRHYVISGATCVEDVLTVVRLGRLAGVKLEGSERWGPGCYAGAAVRVDRGSAECVGGLPGSFGRARIIASY